MNQHLRPDTVVTLPAPAIERAVTARRPGPLYACLSACVPVRVRLAGGGVWGGPRPGYYLASDIIISACRADAGPRAALASCRLMRYRQRCEIAEQGRVGSSLRIITRRRALVACCAAGSQFHPEP